MLPPSPPADPDASARLWQRAIRRTRTRIHLGWFADTSAPLSLAASLAGCTGLLLLHSLHRLPDPQGPAFALSLGAGLLLLAVLAALLARRHFISLEEAATRLDAHLGLHNALSAARSGLRPWPPASSLPRTLPHGLRWDWPRLLAPPVLAALLIALPFFLPGPAPETPPLPPNAPLAWETVEEWLATLAEEELADPEDLLAFSENLEALRQAPPEQWFQHSSLEATDSLQEALERSLHDLQAHLSRAAQSLTLLDRAGQPGSLSAADRETLQNQLRQSLEGFANGDLGLHPSLLEQLRQIDPSSLAIDPAAAPALREALRQNAQALRDLMDRSAGLTQEWENRLRADELLGEVTPGQPGSLPTPGQGAPERGPGEAPIHYGENPVDLGTSSPERLSGAGPEHAAPGDLLGVQSTAPSTGSRPLTSQSAGTLSSPGQGGHQVWESHLLPSERAILRKYFR